MKSQMKKLISIFACVCLLLTAIVIPASAAETTASYVKVTEAPDDWSGDYLIVYEGGKKAYNGALTDLKKANGTAVTITDSKIEATDAMKAAQFTIAAVDGGYTIKSASGYYIGRTSSNTQTNDLLFSTSTQYVNTISMNGSDVDIVSGNTYLRWNSQSTFFRYYKATTYTGQAAIALYKLEEANTPEEPETPVEPEEPDTPVDPEPDTPVEPETPASSANLSFAPDENRTAYSTTQQIWEQNGIKVTNNKSGSTTNIRDNLGDDHIRLYAGSDVIIEYPGMTKIEIVAPTKAYAEVYGNTNSDANATITVADTGAGDNGNHIVTVVFANAVDSFAFTGLKAQTRMRELTVYTGSTTGGETPEEPDTPVEPEEPDTPDVPAADSTLTIEAAAALGAGMTHNTTTEGKYYVSGVIKSVANTTYGNMTIQDDAGNTLYIYGTYSADGANRYDAMEVKPVAGDTVKLYGVIGNYNGAQMKNGWIVEHTPATTPEEPDTPVVPDEPDEPDTPVVPDEPDTPAESATITFDADKANRTEYDNNHQIWAQNGITVTNNKAASTTNVGNYGNPGRFYKGSEVIIEYPGMTKIVIESVTYNDNDYAGAWVDSFDTTLGTATAVDGDVTIVLNSAVDSLTFASMAAQGRAYTITVYTTVEGGETPEEPDTPVVPDEPDTPVTPEANTLTIVEAIALGGSKEHNTYTTDKYYVTGEITEVYNTQYGNMKIKDADGNILTIYGTYDADGTNRYDAMEVKPVAGDTVKLYGIIGQYNGTPQMKNGWIVEHTPATTPEDPEDPDTPENPDPEADSELTIVEAIALGASKAHNTYTEGKYYITAKITEVYGPQYGNFRVTDADGNILTIYGSWSADGEVRYDALEEKPIAGDTVKLYGIIGQYNDTPQMKNAWIIEIVEKGEGEAPVAPETAEEILADAAELNPGETLPYSATLTGTVVSIDYEFSEEYGNITVTIEVKDTDGKTIQCFRMKGEGADTLAVGDDITVTGFITNFNGTVQFNTGATFVPAVDDPTVDDPTVDDPTVDDPTVDDPTVDDPTGDKPADDKPAEDKPAEDKPAEDKPADDKPADDTVADDDTTADDDTAADDTVADDDTAADDTTSPETGDSVAAVATMALAAAAVILYTRKRR